MFASIVSLVPGLLIAGFFVIQSKTSSVEGDLEALLARMRQRLYPETLPVLASYWLKTVATCYRRAQWKKLNRLLKRVLGEQVLDDPSRQTIVDMQTWIQQTVLVARQPPRTKLPLSDQICATLSSDLLEPYINRLLNVWLPAELARLKVHGSASTLPREGGIPPLLIGRALEGLLVRERLSPRALEMLLQPEPFSPRSVYPADVEILQDVILFLLGWAWAPARSVMPAILLWVAPDSLLPANYGEALLQAFLVPQPGEEVRVPIALAQALEILNDEPVRIGSIIVTMDGRWWEAVRLQSREPPSVVYRPMGRLRLDYVMDEVRLRVPWREIRLSQIDCSPIPDTIEIFGREWHLSQREQDGKRTWLHLVVSRVLPRTETIPAGDARWWRLRPVSIDLAWSALENALTSSLIQGSCNPIEQLRHSDLIPLGRAIFGLAASLKSRRLPPCELIESHLKDICSVQGQVSSKYGRVPWRILPARVHASLFKIASYPALREHLNQVFDSLPQRLSMATSPDPRPDKAPAVEFITLGLTTTLARDQRFPATIVARRSGSPEELVPSGVYSSNV